ncbi:MAG: protease modulator HflC [Pseudomonadales bacterium]|nr:protease modulator HflC [Pseudomonadales bacterium]MCP5216056.1 protease modulator HflC [Pseudomonadales bacterium]
MTSRSLISLITIFLVLLVGFQCMYIVSERERAVLLKFGEVVKTDVPPGLHFKIPFVNKVRKFDGRLLTLDSQSQRFLTLEKKAVIVDSYVKWRISSVEKYYTATSGDEFVAARLLSARVDTGLRNQFGERSMHEVVSGERDELMTELTHNLNDIAQKELGMEVLDVRVKGIDLPPEVSSSVFNRMATERDREARDHRAKGKELAEGISADADRQKTVIEAKAFRDAEKIRGEGDALAAATYAQAYNQDPEFYAFYRSLKAYKETFSNKGDILILKPDSEFFKYLNKKK